MIDSDREKLIRPKVSFIVVARNDNYGGDFLYRLHNSISALLILCEKHCFNMELVIVEWNPPEDSSRLANTFTWMGAPQYCKVRVIEVPEEIHRKLPNPDNKPLFEFTGKNVGVRRAQSDFILVTNPDILFSEELIEFLAFAKLSPECFYRLPRYDVESPIPCDVPVEEKLAYCQQHVIQVHGYYSSFDYRIDRRSNIRRLRNGIIGNLIWRLRNFPFDPPFSNASGDFLLMHKSHWHYLRGYPEVEGLSHIDTIMSYMVAFHRLKQVRLRSSLRIYHQDHGRPESGKPFSPEVLSLKRQLLAARKPIILNDETWGLGAYDLPETIIA